MTVAAVLIGLLVLGIMIVGDVIALAGRAICDGEPPNYPTVVVLTVVGAVLLWVTVLIWRAVCSPERYRT